MKNLQLLNLKRKLDATKKITLASMILEILYVIIFVVKVSFFTISQKQENTLAALTVLLLPKLFVFFNVIFGLMSVTTFVLSIIKIVMQFKLYFAISELDVKMPNNPTSTYKTTFLIVAVLNIFLSFVGSIIFLVFASKLRKKIDLLEFNLEKNSIGEIEVNV